MSLTKDNKTYRVTPEVAWEWYNILNEQIFGNLLEPVSEIYIYNHDDVYAYYHYWNNSDPKKKPSYMSFDKKFKDEKFFVEVLGHEMIHHFQHTNKETLGHGPSFLAWQPNFNLKGLNLYRA